jgi:hypothetical protein
MVCSTTLTFGILLRAYMRQLTYGPYERLPVRFNPQPASAHNLREGNRKVGCKDRLKVVVRHGWGKHCYLTLSHACTVKEVKRLLKASK